MGESAPQSLGHEWEFCVILEVISAQVFGTNCWIFAPSKNSECFIVDPGITAPSIVPALSEVIRKYNLKPIATLITHGHLDHTFSVLPFSREYEVPTYIQRLDRKLLVNPFLALSPDGPTRQIVKDLGVTSFEEPEVVSEFAGGESFTIAGLNIQTIHAPGHTAGSAMFLVNGEHLISGDVLFRDGIGRTDMPTGSASLMVSTLENEILTLDDSINVLPGHGEVTTIGRERKQSPFLRPEFLASMRKGEKRG